jgi:hypothetical protein
MQLEVDEQNKKLSTWIKTLKSLKWRGQKKKKVNFGIKIYE